MVFRIWKFHTIIGGSLLALSACGSQNGSLRTNAMVEPSELSPRELTRSASGPAKSGSRQEGEQLEVGRAPELHREKFIKAVLARNPNVEVARSAFRAAKAKRVQREALDDPMLSYSFGPLSIASSMRYGQVIELSQRFPWPGKLDSLGEAAEADAEAALAQYQAVRLDLALAASLLFDEYYLVERALEVNREHQAYFEQLGQSAQSQYAVGRASLQDPLQAEIGRVQLLRDELALKADREVAIARMNALLHRPPDADLPPAPKQLSVNTEPPKASAVLQRQAIRDRTELRAEKARVRASEARVEYAGREYYPDFTVMASYNSMWNSIEHQLMVGIAAPLPIQRGSRRGAVDEANAVVAEARHEQRARVIEIRREVEVARTRVIEAIQVVRLYSDKILPLVRDRLRAAQAGFESGANDFAAVIAAEDDLREAELKHYVAKTQLSQRRAELERATGQPPGIASGQRPRTAAAARAP